MNVKIFNYIIVFLFTVSYIEVVIADDDFSSTVSSMKNPFVSPVIVKKAPVEVKKREVPPKPKEIVLPPVNDAPVPVNPPVLKITGLVWNSVKPQAIINGKIVSQGGEIDGSKLIAVRKGEIDVLYAGQQFTLSSQSTSPTVPLVPINRKQRNNL